VEKNKMGGECSMYMGEERCIRFLVGKHEGKIPLARPWYRWEDNTEMDLHDVGWGSWT